ncbi:MAG: hypothetical protein AAB295_04820 [Chloroflexota bacterium]
MTVAEAGRMGGRLVSEKYGSEFYERIGKKGGKAIARCEPAPLSPPGTPWRRLESALAALLKDANIAA